MPNPKSTGINFSRALPPRRQAIPGPQVVINRDEKRRKPGNNPISNWKCIIFAIGSLGKN